MKAINFHFGETAVTGAWARVAFTEILGRFQAEAQPRPIAAAARGGERKHAYVSLFERLDRWVYRQQQRDREVWLSGSQDMFEIEERIRYLERAVGGRYY
ncbi:MAG: hypothetical protein ABI537_15540 [Casimicrobiaceae bacterium]